ncbi:MAG: hypothetical protein E7417_03455 [Ruminococcaceae bacterium]|nr:hypothetical protein [Oscillospiraceae bacterium]
MKKKILSGIVSLMMAVSCVSPVLAADKASGEIKNIIYMIPDGGGMSPFNLADALKQAGGWDRNVYPNSTVTEQSEMYLKQYLVGAITTHSANAEVTDSAAAGTALSSGYKTNNGYIGMTPDKIPQANILEAAQYVGKNVGLVTTCEWANATPAAFAAHEKDRGNYAPMSEQMVNQGLEVVLSSGFGAAKWGDISEAEIRGYDIIETREDLEAIKPGDKVWGNVVDGTLPYDIENDSEKPNLAELTKAAITALDDGNDEGFFLMVEGSQVDGGGHTNNVRAMVGEFLAFDEACKVALNYAEGREDTLVVVVPDHDTGGMILPEKLDDAVESLKKGVEPSDVSWETTGHTARHGGMFMYVPEGIEYPDGISGKDIGTEKAFEENVVDNTVIAPYLADLMGVKLEDVTKNLFIDVTDMGTYDEKLGLFSFNDYPVAVKRNASYAYVNDEVADLDGQVTVLAKDRFYVPQVLLDIAGGKDYQECEFASPISSTMETFMPDTLDVNKWNARIKVSNMLAKKQFKGKIKFTYPEQFAAMEAFDITVDGMSESVIEFECPKFPPESIGLAFKYDIIAEDGAKYSYESRFKGLAYAGYADSEITIDGKIDEKAWENGVVMTCDDVSKIVMIEGWKGERDLSADFSILWDEEYFYMYAVVTDEVFCPETPTIALWRGDSVQFGIYHDTENALIKGTAGDKYEEIGMALLDGKPAAYRFITQKDLTEVGEIEIGNGFDIAIQKDGIDTIYELKATWKDLFGYEFTPEVGGVLGFSALINDNDGDGRRGWIEYGSGIGLSKDVNQFVMMPLLNFSENNDEIKILVNGEKVTSDVPPVIIEDRTLVPVRAIFEALGAEVEWDDATKTVISKLGDSTVSMQIGNKDITVDGETKEIDVPAQIVNDRTLVPVRAVSESYGATVEWDADTKTVIITK